MNRTQVLKFVNECHSPANGQFCSDGSVLGRVVDNVDLRDINKTHPERFGAMVRVMGIIDKIHGVPAGYPVASVEVFGRLGSGNAQGAYDPGSHLIKLAEDFPEFAASTLVHEYGHHLTLAVHGESKMDFLKVMHADPELAELHRVIRATPQWKEMALRESAGGSAGEKASYLKDPRELFARAYFQYIATKSGDKTLLGQLDKLREATHNTYQWTDSEFKPIGAAMEAHLKARGWLK